MDIDKKPEKPRFYYMDLDNYTDEFLKEIIIWQMQEMERRKQLGRDEVLNALENNIKIIEYKMRHKHVGSKKHRNIYALFTELNKLKEQVTSGEKHGV